MAQLFKTKNHDNHISAIEILTAQLLYFTVQMCKCYVYELLPLKKQSGKSSETKNEKREKKSLLWIHTTQPHHCLIFHSLFMLLHVKHQLQPKNPV